MIILKVISTYGQVASTIQCIHELLGSQNTGNRTSCLAIIFPKRTMLCGFSWFVSQFNSITFNWNDNELVLRLPNRKCFKSELLILREQHCTRPEDWRPTHSCKMGTGNTFSATTRRGYEPGFSSSSSADVKDVWSYTSTPLCVYTTLVKVKVT